VARCTIWYCGQQHCMVNHIKYSFTKFSSEMGTVEFVDLPAFRISLSCRCRGRSVPLQCSLKAYWLCNFRPFPVSLYAKWVNFQGLWNRLTAGTLPIAHVTLIGEWIELEHGRKPTACGLHAARQLVLCGSQPRKIKYTHTLRRSFFLTQRSK
jgi:hypothetical protein